MSRAVVFFAAALVAAADARPAEAGWKNTRWDMSPAEFRALYPQATRLEPSNVNENWEARFALYGVAHDGWTWDKAELHFLNGKLDSVSLKTSGRVWGTMVTEYRARFGAPDFELAGWVSWCESGEGVSVNWSVDHPEYGTWLNYRDCGKRGGRN